MATLERTPRSSDRVGADLSGLDALEMVLPPKRRLLSRIWSALWPKLAAVAIALGIWQLVVWSGWKPEYLLPPPKPVFETLFDDFGTIMEGLGNTLERAFIGFGFALAIGVVLGALVSQSRILRAAIGSMITGLQTMPSIAWFPLAFILFSLSEGAIYFVVILGAAPSIANGIIGGVDHIQPVLRRAGRVLGARGVAEMRHIVLPAALPSFVGGLKQGWAFAWRSLLAGELLALSISGRTMGGLLQINSQTNDYEGVIAVMIVLLAAGIVIDGIFGTLDKQIRRRYGLIDTAID
jgi:NitT/TauT family transport system permease protein